MEKVLVQLKRGGISKGKQNFSTSFQPHNIQQVASRLTAGAGTKKLNLFAVENIVFDFMVLKPLKT